VALWVWHGRAAGEAASRLDALILGRWHFRFFPLLRFDRAVEPEFKGIVAKKAEMGNWVLGDRVAQRMGRLWTIGRASRGWWERRLGLVEEEDGRW
jgi:hypothetical protein